MDILKNIELRPGNASYSKLQLLKTLLMGEKPFSGDEKFLYFGSAFHELTLIYKTKFVKVSKPDQLLIKGMKDAVYRDRTARNLLEDTIREQRQVKEILGTTFTYILDAYKQKIGADLKSTACETETAFINYAIKHGLIVQALVYMLAENLKQFYFIAVNKKPPHKVFILPAHKYPAEMKYAMQELKFLLYIFNKIQNGKDKTTNGRSQDSSSTVIVNGEVKKDIKEVGRKDNIKTGLRTGAVKSKAVKRTVKGGKGRKGAVTGTIKRVR